MIIRRKGPYGVSLAGECRMASSDHRVGVLVSGLSAPHGVLRKITGAERCAVVLALAQPFSVFVHEHRFGSAQRCKGLSVTYGCVTILDVSAQYRLGAYSSVARRGFGKAVYGILREQTNLSQQRSASPDLRLQPDLHCAVPEGGHFLSLQR